MLLLLFTSRTKSLKAACEFAYREVERIHLASWINRITINVLHITKIDVYVLIDMRNLQMAAVCDNGWRDCQRMHSSRHSNHELVAKGIVSQLAVGEMVCYSEQSIGYIEVP